MIWTVALILSGLLPPAAAHADRVTSQDTHGDAVARRTDAGADGFIDPVNHRLPDLLSWTIGTWKPGNPKIDPFSGTWANTGDFFRLDLVFEGLVNPPGPVGCCGEAAFEPFRYGPCPVSGYIEIDVDQDADTGGELEWFSLRYLGNTSRFGGLPRQASISERAAIDARAFDGNLVTPPQVERSGEDFHLELVGWETSASQIERSDTSDWLFGTGETWVLSGCFFHRAHGYSPFSSACCRTGVSIGNYEPPVKMQFSHVSMSDRTTVSLVYPLTNAGSASMAGSGVVEPADALFTNQNSVSEGLWELVISAFAATSVDRSLPEFALIAPWEHKNPDEYLDPARWRVTMLLGSGFTSPEDALFVWSDLYPDVKTGDLNGDGNADSADLGILDAYLLQNDGDPSIDADGQINGSIEIVGFGPSFSLCDLNYDGLVDSDDGAMIGGSLSSRADFDHDGDIDMVDFGHLQVCLTGGSGTGLFGPGCRNADLDRDFDVDQDDIGVFVQCASGPAIAADPTCGRN
ncbi:MAG TPA: dockerin type I repeat-containing protein [Phycisphaerae bacterium]|nr:dockerin type I repeat-containing protein [Phycisphaerae bacterium]HRY71253.1 dockerin type I repeat-containing protein [Phycisphaerae bacterium]HSA29667.1 dockerin type I repeat-containing protein [Phycisphaerae bacterium]